MAFLQPPGPTISTKEVTTTINVTATAASDIETQKSRQETTTISKEPVNNESQIPGESTPPLGLGHKLCDPRAAIVKISPLYLDRLKSITATLLPVRYSDKFFTECLEPEKHSALSFVALYDSQPVGWIRCRVEPFPNAENEVYQQIYIQAVGILAPFRGLGLAAGLLEAVKASVPSTHPKVRSVYAHVWESNADALTWYDKQGFRRIMVQQQYYRRLKPSGAWIVRKELG